MLSPCGSATSPICIIKHMQVCRTLGNIAVEALRPDDPRCCQMDARFQPRLSYGLVVPAKDVRTGCPDTPSDGFVSHI